MYQDVNLATSLVLSIYFSDDFYRTVSRLFSKIIELRVMEGKKKIINNRIIIYKKNNNGDIHTILNHWWSTI